MNVTESKCYYLNIGLTFRTPSPKLICDATAIFALKLVYLCGPLKTVNVLRKVLQLFYNI